MAVPTLVDLEGFSHRVVGASFGGGAPGMTGLWDGKAGDAQLSFDTTNKRLSAHVCSLKIDMIGASASMKRNLPGTSGVTVLSFYIRVVTAPASNAEICKVEGAVNTPKLVFNTNGSVRPWFGTTPVGTASANIADGNWHRIDWYADTSGTTYHVWLSVDGTVATNDATLASQTGASATAWRMGTTGADTLTIWYGDIVVSQTAGDYPIGPHAVLPINPNAEGTDVLGSTNPIIQGGSGSGSMYTSIDDWASGAASDTDYFTYTSATTGDAASNYAEVLLTGVTAGFFQIWDVLALLCMSADGTGANTFGYKVRQGGNDLVNQSGLDCSTGLGSLGFRRDFVTRPSGGWNTLKVGTLSARFGFSTDTSADPRFCAFTMEYAAAEGVVIQGNAPDAAAGTLTPIVTGSTDATVVQASVPNASAARLTPVITASSTVVKAVNLGAWVRQNFLGNPGSTAPITFFLTAAADAGDTLVMAISAGSNARIVTGVTDSQGNTWTVDATVNPNTSRDLSVCSAYMAHALSLTDTITITFDADPAGATFCEIEEYSGVLTSSRLDKFVAANGANAEAADSGATATTTVQTELVVGVLAASGNVVATPTSWWTKRRSTSGRVTMADRFVNFVGAWDVAWTWTGQQQWVAVTLTYKVTAAPIPSTAAATLPPTATGGVGGGATVSVGTAAGATADTPGAPVPVAQSLVLAGTATDAGAGTLTVTFTRSTVLVPSRPNATANRLTPFVGLFVVVSPPCPNASAARLTPTPSAAATAAQVSRPNATAATIVSPVSATVFASVARATAEVVSLSGGRIGTTRYIESRFLNAVLRNTPLAVTQAYASLHSAYPGGTGANELAGTYTRQAVAFDAPDDGVSDNTGIVDFPNMPAGDVVAVGLWDTPVPRSGNCLWTMWVSTAIRAVTASGDLLTSFAHGLVAGDRVAFEAVGSTPLPGGVSAGTLYWVVAGGLTDDAFKIATTQGGSPITFSTSGSGLLFKVAVKRMTLGDVYRLDPGSLAVAVG